jgi:hypothetical protein
MNLAQAMKYRQALRNVIGQMLPGIRGHSRHSPVGGDRKRWVTNQRKVFLAIDQLDGGQAIALLTAHFVELHHELRECELVPDPCAIDGKQYQIAPVFIGDEVFLHEKRGLHFFAADALDF